MTLPVTVTVAIPVLNEERHIARCLAAVERQTHPVAEILVIDGGSTDRTRELAVGDDVRILDNPRRIQAAALNVALTEATGDVIVRVDGHCEIAPDYVEHCVKALAETGAAMVGGGMTPVTDTWLGRGIAAAMSSRLGAGPARFHTGGESGWVDTVYLGAYRRDVARTVGGYAEDVGVNEDAEFAIRMSAVGGVWFDTRISSAYVPRSSLGGLARQFYRYGLSRAATVRRHPRSVKARQMAAPALVLAMIIPRRRKTVIVAYAALVVARSSLEARRDSGTAIGFAMAMPIMHVTWGVGFLQGLVTARGRPR